MISANIYEKRKNSVKKEKNKKNIKRLNSNKYDKKKANKKNVKSLFVNQVVSVSGSTETCIRKHSNIRFNYKTYYNDPRFYHNVLQKEEMNEYFSTKDGRKCYNLSIFNTNKYYTPYDETSKKNNSIFFLKINMGSKKKLWDNIKITDYKLRSQLESLVNLMRKFKIGDITLIKVFFLVAIDKNDTTNYLNVNQPNIDEEKTSFEDLNNILELAKKKIKTLDSKNLNILKKNILENIKKFKNPNMVSALRLFYNYLE